MTKIISFLGGPSCGKSTIAPYLYSKMKYSGFSVEFIPEWCKHLAYLGTPLTQYDQNYIFAKQTRLESQLYGKVDYIVSDSSILLPIIYEHHYHGDSISEPSMWKYLEKVKMDGVTHLNYLINRNIPFVEEGRFESPSEAQKIDEKIVDFLDKNSIYYTELMDNSPESAKIIMENLC